MNGISKAKLILYLAIIFAAGGVTGAMFAARATKQMMAAEAPRPGRLESRYLKERFQSKLKLTPEQSKVIDPILEKMSDELKNVRQDCTKRISTIMKSSYDQIGKQLTAEQRRKLDEMQKDHREPPHKRPRSWGEPFRKPSAPAQNE